MTILGGLGSTKPCGGRRAGNSQVVQIKDSKYCQEKTKCKYKSKIPNAGKKMPNTNTNQRFKILSRKDQMLSTSNVTL